MFNLVCAVLSVYGAVTNQWWMLWVFLGCLLLGELVRASAKVSELALEKEKNKLKQIIKEKINE